jgi:hypothetical protein
LHLRAERTGSSMNQRPTGQPIWLEKTELSSIVGLSP